MKITIDGVEVQKFGVSDGSDGSRLVTILLPPEPSFPAIAGDLAGRLEQIRALITSGGAWKVQAALDIIDGKVTGLTASREAEMRNGVGQTTAETFGSPPDPILIARFMLDALTGGALSSLICQLRDATLPQLRKLTMDGSVSDVEANLRALGEKIE